MVWLMIGIWIVTTILMMWWQVSRLYVSDKVFIETAKTAGKYHKVEKYVGIPIKIIMMILFIGVLAGICGYLTWFSAYSPMDIAKLLMAFVCIASISFVDYKEHIIPNIIPIIMMTARAIIAVFELFLRKNDFLGLIIASLVGGLVILLILYVLSFATRGGLRLGDVKILSALGFLCGLYAVVSTLLYSLIICVIFSAFLLMSKRKTMKDKVPFEPFILIGYAVTLLLGTY